MAQKQEEQQRTFLHGPFAFRILSVACVLRVLRVCCVLCAVRPVLCIMCCVPVYGFYIRVSH